MGEQQDSSLSGIQDPQQGLEHIVSHQNQGNAAEPTIMRFGVYSAYFTNKGDRNPFLKIDSGRIPFKEENGVLVRGNACASAPKNLWQRLMDGEEIKQAFNVKIMRHARDHPVINYFCVETDEPLHHRTSVEVNAEAAKRLSLINSPGLFYASYEYTDIKNSIFMQVFNPDRAQHVGILCSPYAKYSFKSKADRILIADIFSTLKPGSRLIVRKIGEDPRFAEFLLKPVINFEEECMDMAYSDTISGPQLLPIVTSVGRYAPGSIIRNLPIILSGNLNEGPFGKGMLPANNHYARFYYIPVYLFGAEQDVGKYVKAAEILTIGHKFITARKLA